MVHPDGSNLTKLVTLPGRLLGRGYSWSPDGRKIAFSHTPHVEYLSSDYFQIFTIDIYSGEIYQLTNGNENHRYPVWSPDGSRIAFFSGEDYLLSTVHADGGNIKVISEDPRVSAEYSWSPDGTRIAYEIVDGYLNASIWLMDANGKKAHQFETEYLDLDTEYNYAGSPVWMPDGDHMVFLKQHDLYYGDIEGESSIRLTFTLDYPELWFDVSPDGSMIAFINYDGTYIYLKIIDLQGNVISEEKIGDSFEVDFDWSADSQAVVLTAEDQLWLYFVDDQNLLKILDCPGKCRNPQWQP